MPAEIHPRTRSDVAYGSRVIVRDARGGLNERYATTGVEWGRDFLVVWVCPPDQWPVDPGCAREFPSAVPWPAEDVWLPEDAPGA
jgi:hypothetical protein